MIKRMPCIKNERHFVSKIVIGDAQMAMRNASQQENEYENEGAKVMLY